MRKGFVIGAIFGLLLAGVIAVDAATGGKLGEQFMTLTRAIAGERNPSSETGTDYLSTSAECKPSGEIDISAGSGTIYNGPAIVQWVQISTTPGTAASSIDDNTTAKIPLPVSFPVGVHPFSGAVFCTSLKYTKGASATGKMNVCYRPLDSSQVTWACP